MIAQNPFLLLLAAAVLPLSPAAAQEKLAEAPAEKSVTARAIKVATFRNHKSFEDFQKNVQLVKGQRAAVVKLRKDIEGAEGEAKAGLEKQLEGFLAKLDENNRAMMKNYGYSIGRNYMVEHEVSHLYMFVTDEEYDKWKKEQEAGESKKKEEAAE